VSQSVSDCDTYDVISGSYVVSSSCLGGSLPVDTEPILHTKHHSTQCAISGLYFVPCSVA